MTGPPFALCSKAACRTLSRSLLSMRTRNDPCGSSAATRAARGVRIQARLLHPRRRKLLSNKSCWPEESIRQRWRQGGRRIGHYLVSSMERSLQAFGRSRLWVLRPRCRPEDGTACWSWEALVFPSGGCRSRCRHMWKGGAAEQGVEADEARSTSELRSLTP